MAAVCIHTSSNETLALVSWHIIIITIIPRVPLETETMNSQYLVAEDAEHREAEQLVDHPVIWSRAHKSVHVGFRACNLNCFKSLNHDWEIKMVRTSSHYNDFIRFIKKKQGLKI